MARYFWERPLKVPLWLEDCIRFVSIVLLLASLPFLFPLAGVLISITLPEFVLFFGLPFPVDWGGFWAAARIILKVEAIVCGVVAAFFVFGLTVMAVFWTVIGIAKDVAHLRSRFGLTYFALRRFPRAIRLQLQGRVADMMDRLPLPSRSCARWGLSPLVMRSSSPEEFMRTLLFLEELVERLKKEPGLKIEKVSRREFVALASQVLTLRCMGQDYTFTLFPEQGHTGFESDSGGGASDGGMPLTREVYIVDAPQRVEITPC